MSTAPTTSEHRPRTVLLTGATGFLGQALLERFLRERAVVHLVIRPRAGVAARDRLAALLTKDCFDAWREEVGSDGVAAAMSRLHVIEADLSSELPALPSDLDLVVHSASNVSFDEPWDRAVHANVLGPAHLYDALRAARTSPHVVHVSTSYVGTDRVAVSRERSVEHAADWRTEVELARARRADLDRAAAPGVSTDEVMRERGRRRAAELGWTDVYTMTKSLGERVAEEKWAGAGHRLTILRPTIIESALHRPHPGWMDGFKVADPLIAAFAKGRLTAFPGRPDAVIDIVPVDVVVDAAMAASVIHHDGVRYLQVGTGVSNPIRLDDFRLHVEEAIHADPWTDRSGRPIVPRPWRFVSPENLDSWVGRRVTALRTVTRTLSMLPDGWARSTRRRVDASSRSLSLLRNYVGIYQSYTCSRTVYDDSATRRLLVRARELGVAGALDVTEIDWRHYIRGTHLPSLRRLAETHRRAKAPGPSDDATGTASPVGARPVTPPVVQHPMRTTGVGGGGYTPRRRPAPMAAAG